jgi:hypothetical protein
MGDIKSSWEIIRNKVDALGDLSPEERKKQSEERCQPIGKSLADEFLAGRDIRQVEKDLLKYPVEDRNCIRQFAIRHLIDVIKLENSSILDRTISGILTLSGKEDTEKIIARINDIFCEYGDMEKSERNNIEAAGREMLHQQRISGSAIAMINLRAKEEWRRKLSELAQLFEERLTKLKNELLQQITASLPTY